MYFKLWHNATKCDVLCHVFQIGQCYIMLIVGWESTLCVPDKSAHHLLNRESTSWPDFLSSLMLTNANAAINDQQPCFCLLSLFCLFCLLRFPFMQWNFWTVVAVQNYHYVWLLKCLTEFYRKQKQNQSLTWGCVVGTFCSVILPCDKKYVLCFLIRQHTSFVLIFFTL